MSNDRVFTRLNKVLLIYTGGTIGMGLNPRTNALEPLDFDHLISNLPEFSCLQTDVDVYQFNEPIDSSDMSPRKWAQLVRIISKQYDQYDGLSYFTAPTRWLIQHRHCRSCLRISPSL